MERNPKENPGEVYINFVATNAVLKSMGRSEIEEESRKDKVIPEVIAAVKSGKWQKSKDHREPEIRALFRLRHELSVTDNGILLRGRQIVIPQSLRQRTLSIVHKTHQGIVKTKMLLRLTNKSLVAWNG